MRGGGVALSIVALCFAVIFSVPLADHLILFPTTAPVETHGAARKTLPFGTGQLEVWTARSQRAQLHGRAQVFVLRFYGNADRADRWATAEAEAWNDRAAEIWGMNYPGFGGSTGPARLSQIAPAATTAFDALQREAKERPVVLFGASLGTAAALHIAAHRPVAGLILRNPVPLRPIILRQFGWWNLWLLAGPVALKIPPDLDSVANARRTSARAVFLLAERDEVVAPRYHRLVVDAYAGQKRVIALPGAYHNSPIEGTALADLNNAVDWLLPQSTER